MQRRSETSHRGLAMSSVETPAARKEARGMRAAQAGLLVNLALVAVKLVAGIVGHAYALIADAMESTTDLFGSLVVWAEVKW